MNFGGGDFARAVALQPDGGIVVVGYSVTGGKADIAVARLLGDPRPGASGAGGPGGGGTGGTTGPPRCGGRRATVVGTAGRDVLRGTKRANVIAALGGNDVVRGGRRRHRLRRPRERPHLRRPGSRPAPGGPGADRLLGGAAPTGCS